MNNLEEDKVKRVVIFGTEQRGDETYDILKCISEYEVVAFSDNDKTKWNGIKRGLNILPPTEIRTRYPESILVIASSYYADIWMQLNINGWIPQGGCMESVNQIIGDLSDFNRKYLISEVCRKTTFYNLHYIEKAITEVEKPNTEKYLIICNGGYPKKGNPRCAFAHRRTLEYIKKGIKVEAFGFIPDTSLETYEYQGVKVWQGGIAELQRLIECRKYQKILIHFIEIGIMYAIWKAGAIEMPMIVYMHGYEGQKWNRIYFCYSEEEIKANKENWEKYDTHKLRFLFDIFGMKNITFVFVSEWLKNRVKKNVGRLPENWTVIPNFIDCEFYQSEEKKEEARRKILCIKSHATKIYANDLTAKAILELSQKDYFKELEFHLYGDGVLFEENFKELLEEKFDNVHIHKEFLEQDQVRKLFVQNGILLAPTRMDTHGVIACEGMSAGMAVISCNTGAVPEFINEDSGSLFEFDNYWQLSEEIEYLYLHPEEFLRKARNARERVRKQCGYEATIQKELELLMA